MDEGGSRRWRGSLLALTLMLVLALFGEALVPTAGSAEQKRGRDRDPLRARVERLRDAENIRTPSRKGGVGAEIVGGTTVPQGELKFMTVVFIEVSPGSFIQCGGSLIDPSFVLTAAHCVEDEFGTLFSPDDYILIIGRAFWPDAEDENLYAVANVSRHPAWNPDTFENDVAVLELNEAVPSSVATPLPMVNTSQTGFNHAGQDALVAGWGTTSSGGSSSQQLLKADVDIVSDITCGQAYGAEFVQSVMVCAAAPGRDSCQGDSGGPLMAKEVIGFKVKKKKKHKHRKRRKKKIPITTEIQMGTVSFGEGCADPGFPGVYTRLTAPGINDFIVDVVDS